MRLKGLKHPANKNTNEAMGETPVHTLRVNAKANVITRP